MEKNIGKRFVQWVVALGVIAGFVTLYSCNWDGTGPIQVNACLQKSVVDSAGVYYEICVFPDTFVIGILPDTSGG